jgi:polyhydroxyalkanoate synthase
VLTSGGHNAGVVSEPGHPRRHFRIKRRSHGEHYRGTQEWIGAADLREGSWWLAWKNWLDAHSSGTIVPPRLGSSQYPPLEEAPGRYVHEH